MGPKLDAVAAVEAAYALACDDGAWHARVLEALAPFRLDEAWWSIFRKLGAASRHELVARLGARRGR